MIVAMGVSWFRLLQKLYETRSVTKQIRSSRNKDLVLLIFVLYLGYPLSGCQANGDQVWNQALIIQLINEFN